MRAAIIVNPYSSGMTPKRERAIVQALREYLDLEVFRTERSGHATEIARESISSGAELIVACGGDGTANEVVNGLELDDNTATDRPMLALVPAGGTNVLCRSLGLPNHPVRATVQLAAAIATRRSTCINLGKVDERLFLFSAGVGLDGAIVRRIEEKRSGRRPSDLAHVSTVIGLFARERWALDDRMSLTVDDTGEEMRSALMMCANTAPLSYLGKLKLDPMPDCTLETGLDIMAPQYASAFFAARNALQGMGVPGKALRFNPETRNIRHNISSLHVQCDYPQPVQADGEYIGDRTHLHFRLVPNAIRLVY